MEKLEVTIIDKIGFHARPASKIMNIAAKFKSKIQIQKADGTKGDLKSIMNIMALAIKFGEAVIITAEGADEKEAITEIEKALKTELLI